MIRLPAGTIRPKSYTPHGAAPIWMIWMIFKQAFELDACARKGEHSRLVVYAGCRRRTPNSPAAFLAH